MSEFIGRSAFGFGIALLASAFVTPGDQFIQAGLGGFLLGVGANWGWPT